MTDRAELTEDPANDWDPAVGPDGRLFGSSERTGKYEIWTAESDGSGARQVTRDGEDAENPDATLTGTRVAVVRFEDGEPAAFEVVLETIRPTTANLGRARWMADGRIAFLGQDEKSTNGVFVQDFAPGRETRATRRKLGGFDPEVDAETFGVSPDGSRVVIAGREMVSSLVLLDGVAGLGPSK